MLQQGALNTVHCGTQRLTEIAQQVNNENVTIYCIMYIYVYIYSVYFYILQPDDDTLGPKHVTALLKQEISFWSKTNCVRCVFQSLNR